MQLFVQQNSFRLKDLIWFGIKFKTCVQLYFHRSSITMISEKQIAHDIYKIKYILHQDHKHYSTKTEQANYHTLEGNIMLNMAIINISLICLLCCDEAQLCWVTTGVWENIKETTQCHIHFAGRPHLLSVHANHYLFHGSDIVL